MRIECTSLNLLFLTFWIPVGTVAAQSEPVEVLPAPDHLTHPRDDSTNDAEHLLHDQYNVGHGFLHRIMDITIPEGDRENVVLGTGLVVGLSQTGGRGQQTQTMAQNYFLRQGIATDTPETRSMSAVIVRGTIPPYARKGETIQVNVAVADDATSLRGGILIPTSLKGYDGQIYAMADGPIIGGGVAAGGAAANVQQNHPTAGVCTAIVEREICCEGAANKRSLRLVLRNKDYSTAVSIANAINLIFAQSARAIDSGTVEVRVPFNYQTKFPDFISIIGKLRVHVDQRARVVINQKTGTIVMGQNVRLLDVVFAHESLIISTAETPVASQPAPFSKGRTAILPRTSVDVLETGGRYNPLIGGTTVGELGRALNTLGVSPNLMIAVFTSLRNQGALQAELIIE